MPEAPAAILYGKFAGVINGCSSTVVNKLSCRDIHCPHEKIRALTNFVCMHKRYIQEEGDQCWDIHRSIYNQGVSR